MFYEAYNAVSYIVSDFPALELSPAWGRICDATLARYFYQVDYDPCTFLSLPFAMNTQASHS
jgi:hypothetical protein